MTAVLASGTATSLPSGFVLDVRQVASTATRTLATLMLVAMCWVLWPQTFGGSVAYVRVNGTSMLPLMQDGDLAVVRSHDAYAVGDVVAYRVPSGEFGDGNLVIHRLTGGDGVSGFTTQGDNRTLADPWQPRTADVVGRLALHTGGGDRMATLSQPRYLGLLCGGLTTLVLILPDRRRRDEELLDPYPEDAPQDAPAPLTVR